MSTDSPFVASSVAIGLDFGTSGLKAVAVAADGRVIASASAPYATARPEPDAAEQDPHDWLIAADAALAELARTAHASNWGAIGLSAMLPTLVATDPTGTPLHPAIVWEDRRADPEADAYRAAFGADFLRARTGQHVDGRYLLPMFARLTRIGIRANWMLGAKDWLIQQFTGTALTDPSTAAGSGAYILATGEWDQELLGYAGAPGVPRVVSPKHSEPLLAEIAERWGCPPGTPVVVGAVDSVLGAIGMGVRDAGTIAVVAGTSTVFLAIVDSPATDGPYLVTPTAEGGFACEADLVATGSALAWLGGVLGVGGAAEVVELAALASLENGPIVLPYVGPGEQGVLWDPSLLGTIDGLTLRTTTAEIALGFVAGIVVESKRCVAALGGGHSIVISGSGATPFFVRCLADATGIPVRSDASEHDHSALGAALLAGRSVLGFEDTAEATGIVTQPDPSAFAAWESRFAEHERLRAAVPIRRR